MTRARLPATLATLSLALLGLHLVTVGADVFAPGAYLAILSRWFDLDNEKNLPTLIISLLFLLAGSLSIWHSIRKSDLGNRLFFSVLALLCFYVAVDDYFILHELASEPLRKGLGIGDTSLLYHAWIIPALAAAAAIISYLLLVRKRLVAHFRLHTDILKVIGVCLAVIIIVEVIGTRLYWNRPLYRLLLVPLEEMSEFVMVSYIIASLAKVLVVPVEDVMPNAK